MQCPHRLQGSASPRPSKVSSIRPLLQHSRRFWPGHPPSTNGMAYLPLLTELAKRRLAWQCSSTEHRRLRARTDAKFLQDVTYVNFDGYFTDVERFGYFPIGHSVTKKFENLSLSFR